MQLIPIEKLFSNRDSIRTAREAFLIQKGRTIDPDGLNIIILFYYMLIFDLHCQLVLLVSRMTKICYIKTRPHVNTILIVPEEGWFGQPKYRIPSKNHPTLCRILLLYSPFYM